MHKVSMGLTIAKEKTVRLKQLKDTRPKYEVDLEHLHKQ
jgi:ubiquitin